MDTLTTANPSASGDDRSEMQNSQSPYFLHHSDTSNLVLVSERLTDENYVSWSRSMVLALSIKNKLGFIDGSIVKPAGQLLPLWVRNNNIVIAWILNSVSKNISSSILFTDSAQAIWLDLKDRFAKKNGSRIFHLKREMSTFRQEQQTVTMYYAKLKSLWDEYVTYRPGCTYGACTCGGMQSIEEFFQFKHLLNFLMGLNESYGHSRSQILLMDPPPAVNKAFSLIVQEEEQRVHLPNVQVAPTMGLAVNQAFAVNQMQHNQPRNNNQQASHRTMDNNGRIDLIALIAIILGHTVDPCYKIHGYPPGYRQRGGQRTNNQYNNGNNNNQYNANASTQQSSTQQTSGQGATNIATTVNSASTSTATNICPNVDDPFTQCHNILNMLQSKLAAVKTESEVGTQYLAGKVHFEDDWQG